MFPPRYQSLAHADEICEGALTGPRVRRRFFDLLPIHEGASHVRRDSAILARRPAYPGSVSSPKDSWATAGRSHESDLAEEASSISRRRRSAALSRGEEIYLSQVGFRHGRSTAGDGGDLFGSVGPEPQPQRRPSAVEDHPRRNRHLTPAHRALPTTAAQPPPSTPHAPRTAEPVRPAQPLKVVEAGGLVREPRQELRVRARVVLPYLRHMRTLPELDRYPPSRESARLCVIRSASARARWLRGRRERRGDTQLRGPAGARLSG